MKKSSAIILLSLIVLLGIFLRVYNLDAENIWVDESFSLTEAEKENLSSLIDFLSVEEGIPPGYPLLLKGWIGLFGNSEFSIRFLSVIFGVGSIILMYLLASSIWGRKVGLISSLFVSTAMLQVLYSQEARLFAFFGFLALLSTYLLFKALNGKSFIPYFLTTAAALYVNYMTLFLIAFQTSVFYFQKYRRLFKRWLLVQFIILLSFLPLMFLLFKQIFLKHSLWVKLLPNYGVPVFLAKLGNFIFLFPLFAGAAALIAIIYLLKKKDYDFARFFDDKLFIFCLLIMGVMYLFLLERIIVSFSFIRISYFMVPLLYLGMAKGITLLTNKKMQAGVLMVIILFNAFALTQYYYNNTKAPWKVIASEVYSGGDISDNASDDDLLFLFENSGLSGVYIFKYYYQGNPRILSLDEWDNYGGFKRISKNDLVKRLSDEDEFWLISAGRKSYYKDFLNENYLLKEKKEYNWIGLYKYE